MSKLKIYKFSDLYKMSSGISSKPQQAGHGSQFVSFKTVFNNYFLPEVLTEFMDISEKEKEIYSIKKGDILLTRTSETLNELGMSCVAVKDYPASSYSGFLKRLQPTQDDVTYDKFMAFYLRSDLFRKTMTNNSIMTLRASLNEQIFSYLELILPEYKEQKKAGDFLYSLNKKIELNNKINSELELMAKTLYDYWFVQFDFPDRNGKPYKSSGGKMVYNAELRREIPECWEVTALGEICEIYQPKTISEKEMIASGKYFVFGANGIVGKYNEFNHAKSEIVITCRGNSCGNILRTVPNSWITGNAMVLKCINENLSTEWLFNTLKWSNINAVITGSAQPQITRTNISPVKVIVSTEFVNIQFKAIMRSNVALRLENFKENQQLASLRDWLLPMLMNGQVSVGDGEVELDMVAEEGEKYGKQ